MTIGSGSENNLIFAANADFSGSSSPSLANGLATNGQLWIGSTALNAGGTHVNVGTIAGSGGINVTNGAGTITIDGSGIVGGVPSITGTANQVLVNGTSGSAVTTAATLTTPQDIGTASSVTFGNVTLATGGALRTGTGAGNTLRLQAYDTDTGPAYSTFITLTAGTAPEMLITNSLGSFGAPSYTFLGDTNTGLYSPGADNVALMAGGGFSILGDTVSTNIYRIMRPQGGVAYAYNATAISLTVTTSMYIVAVTDTSAARTITLPSAPSYSGTTFVIKDESGGAATNNISVVVSGGVKTIDGLTTQTISTNYGSMTVYYNGSNYFIQ